MINALEKESDQWLNSEILNSYPKGQQPFGTSGFIGQEFGIEN